MALLDEAMAVAIGGGCSDPLTAAHTSCMTMLVCASYFDIERATQWVQAMDRFIERYGCPFLDAECRTNYGRVLFENGDWSAAEQFLAEAIAMSATIPASLAMASGTLAELRLAQGRIEEAERVLDGLHDREEVVVALATLHLARDEPSLAATVLRRRLDAVGSNRLDAAVVVDLLGQAEITLGHADDAARRGEALVALGNANDCHLIIGHGRRLLGLASAGVDPVAARGAPRGCAHRLQPGRGSVPRRASAPCDRADVAAGPTSRSRRPKPAAHSRSSKTSAQVVRPTMRRPFFVTWV